MACVAVLIAKAGNAVSDIRIAMTGVAQTPLRAHAAEELLAGKSPAHIDIETVVSAIRAAVEPNTDLHASADYRRHVVGTIARRAIGQAWQRAGTINNA